MYSYTINLVKMADTAEKENYKTTSLFRGSFVTQDASHLKLAWFDDGLGCPNPRRNLIVLGFGFCAKQVGLDLDTSFSQEPRALLPLPDCSGAWTTCPASSGDVQRWLCGLLSEACSFDPKGVGGHSLKATTLAFLSRWGADNDTRLILGHHSIKHLGSLECYSRDVQAQPLRVLEKCLLQVRQRLFFPDVSRSGLMCEAGEATKVADLRSSKDAAPGANPVLLL